MAIAKNAEYDNTAMSEKIERLTYENIELRSLLQRQAAVIDEQNRKIQQCGINVIVNGRIFDANYRQKFRDEYGIAFESPYFCIVSVSLSDFPSNYWTNGIKRMSVEQYKTTQTMLESLCIGRLSDSYSAYYTYSTVHFGAFLINLLDIDETRLDESMREETNKLTAQFRDMLKDIRDDMGITFYAGISSVYTDERPFRLGLFEAERIHNYLLSTPGSPLADNFYNIHGEFQSGKLSAADLNNAVTDSAFFAPDEEIQLNKRLEHQYYNCAFSFDFNTAGKILIDIIRELFEDSNPNPESARLIAVSHLEYVLNLFGKSLYFGNSTLTEKKVLSMLGSAHDPESFNAVIMDIFTEIKGLFGEPGMKRRSIIDEMTEYIEKNYANPDLNVNRICDYFGYNPSYISRIYKLSTGNGLLETIHRFRIIKAKELLSGTSLSVEQIFRDIGYSNRRTFDRAFKQQVGLSPAGYRVMTPSSID